MQNADIQLRENTLNGYERVFGQPPDLLTLAPGRVNLIGAHIDYNEGFVLPAAIDKYIAVAAGVRRDDKLRIYSENYDALVETSANEPEWSSEKAWSNYVKGVAHFLLQAGFNLTGANVYVRGNIAACAGLSSSAALEMASAYAFLKLNKQSAPEADIIKLCRRAENEFVGVRCGIMDQFVSCLGKKDHTLFLDCRTLEFEYVPLPGDTRILVCDTGIKRELAASEYNRRRKECESGVQLLSQTLSGIRTLRDVSPEQFAKHQDRLPDGVRKRCLHAVAEMQRVQQSVQALKQGRLEDFGQLMYESHDSSRNNYEVSCVELDTIVEICAQMSGVYGARLSGGGFGGAVVCLVREEEKQEVLARLSSEYVARTGREFKSYVCSVVDGVRVCSV